MRRFAWVSAIVAGTADQTSGCAQAHAHAGAPPSVHGPAPLTHSPDRPSSAREQRDGHAFPDGVLALTWDDGPDADTLSLAEFLTSERVSATFFVVSRWENGVSSDPGFGAHVYDSGVAELPLLSDLVALGHRIGNHTLHHVLLGDVAPDVVAREIGDSQRALDPFIGDELRLFRVPGGYWTPAASRVVDADPYLAALVGPVRWDVDAKDWEGAVWCESDVKTRECEHAGHLYRVKPEVMAARYAAAIRRRRHGIVLMHDRVGDVGSRYALDVARHLVPTLIAEGFVFAAPVLAFSPLAKRWTQNGAVKLRLADVNGDGRADACVQIEGALRCALSTSDRDEHEMARLAVDAQSAVDIALPAAATAFDFADVTGDARADVCVTTDHVECAPALGRGGFEEFRVWSDVGDHPVFADIDGDGRADACIRRGDEVRCARSDGARFAPLELWLAGVHGAFALADVNGDARADVCFHGDGGVACAISTGDHFVRPTVWAADVSADFALADLNGDGRSDLCARTASTIACAFSNGRAFTSSSEWSQLGGESWALGDANGDGRADLCVTADDGVHCGVAP